MFAMLQTFLLTINGFRKFKRLRWLVWLIIHGYFRHAVTTSTLDLLSRTMGHFAFVDASRGLKEKPISFCLVLDIFICLPQTTININRVQSRYFLNVQKQPPRGALKKSCSENLLCIFRTPFLKNTSGRLLLNVTNLFDQMQPYQLSIS